MKYDHISFLSDFGNDEEFVGVCKSVIGSIAPSVQITDLTHNVPVFDVRAASLTLVRAANYLRPGVVLAVVDPGGATDRRAVAVELGDGESVLVGPDNGLLAPITAMSGGPTRVVELSKDKYWLTSSPSLFAGRDVFAPVAAHLCKGVDIEELGDVVDPATLVPGLIPFSGEKDGVLHADVIAVNRFGNVQLNVAPIQLDDYGETISITRAGETISVQRIQTFSDVSASKLGCLADADGLVSLVLNQASATEVFGLQVGDALTIRPNRLGGLTSLD